MKLFGQIIRTAVNVAVLPVAVVKDTVNSISIAAGDGKSAVAEQLRTIKREASEE